MGLAAKDRLTLLRVKIERAKHHIKDLERACLDVRGDTHQGYVPHLDPDTGERHDVWTNIPRYSFDILSIAGDVIHNLRSALDHLAYQLAIAGSNATPSRRVEFPIAKDAKTYETEKAGKVKGISPAAIEAIDKLKPYKGGNDILWRIHELDNIDKHRFIFTIGNDALYISPWHPETEDIVGFLLLPRALKADTPLFSGVFEEDPQNNVNFSLAESVGNPKIGQLNSLIPTIHQMVECVEGIIFAFEPFLADSF